MFRSFLAQSFFVNVLFADVSFASAHGLPTRGICAYRGASIKYPENTSAAFLEAIRLGAHMVEMDVCFTKDRQLVLMHDETVDRTTNGNGRVSEINLAEIKRLDAGSWKSSRFEGERVPTLQEVLQILPSNVWIDIHLKGGAEAGKVATQIVIERNCLHQAFIASDPEATAAALKFDSRIMICSMYSDFVNEDVQALKSHNKQRFVVLFKSDLAGRIRESSSRNASFFYYDPAVLPDDLRGLFDSRVHFVASPDVDAFIAAAERQGIKPLKPFYPKKK